MGVLCVCECYDSQILKGGHSGDLNEEIELKTKISWPNLQIFSWSKHFPLLMIILVDS